MSVTPTMSRHNLRDNPTLNLQKDQERILRALSRLHCWQCAACQEIFPISDKPVMGACEQCFMECENLDEHVDFEKVDSLTIANLYRKWLDIVRPYDRFAPLGNWKGDRQAPYEHGLMLSLICWVGEDAIKAAIVKHLSRIAAADRVEVYFDANSVRWTEYGFMPAIQREPWPDITDPKGWARLRDACCLIPIQTRA